MWARQVQQKYLRNLLFFCLPPQRPGLYFLYMKRQKRHAGKGKTPYLPKASRKSCTLSVAITATAHRTIREEATSAGMTVSAWLRMLVDGALALANNKKRSNAK